MALGRRGFLRQAFGIGTLAAAGACGAPATVPASQGSTPGSPTGSGDEVPPSILALRPMTAGIVPIAEEERRARIDKARRLMAEQKIDALFIEPGSSLFYFTSVQWGLSERPFGMVLPARGEIAYISPKFEEARARELTKFSNDVRTWEEDQSPYAVIAGAMRDRGMATGRIGIEERCRFFIYDGIRKEAPRAEFVDATPITAGCRMFKSPAEIALMQRANDITLAAYRAAFETLREGMSQFEFRRNVEAAHRALGAPGGSAGAQFGEFSAFPHGSITPQALKEGDVVLVDGGCKVDGYSSDITRTTVFGTPSQRQIDVWNLEKTAQAAAFEAAKVGVACEVVDAAARKVITDAGFGPDYKVPGLPHRTGHGIGLDGHEWTNFVRGNKTPLAPGMCFSDEPMVAIYGEFGIRLEDCLYMTEAGARFFTAPSPSIDKPFA
ncbi:MAG: Xaa-Pro peptidase family protein [Acidobacteria bacterium]|nr:Xaa-Pro peptidase family protein [Acidobacteriota bacterium]